MYRATNRRSRAGSVTEATLPPPRLQIPDEPPKVPRRPPSKGNKRETLGDIAKRIPVQLMRQYFNYPLRAAAEAMHISVTTLKRLCRRHGVKRWPHRQISGINRALNDLEAQHEVAEGEEMLTVTEQLRQLHRRREVIIELAFESEDESCSSKGFDAAPPAAHKRVKRGSITYSDSCGSSSSSSSSSSSASSSSSSCSSAPSSPSHSRSASFASLASLPETKPQQQPGLGLGSWWKNPSSGGVDIGFAAAAALAKTENITLSNSSSSSSSCSNVSASSDGANTGGIDGNGGAKRPRRPSGGLGNGKAKVQRKPKSSAIFGTIVPPSLAAAAAAEAAATGSASSTATTPLLRKSSSTSSSARNPQPRLNKVGSSHRISAPPSPASPSREEPTTPTPVPASSCSGSDGGGEVEGNDSADSTSLLPSTPSEPSLASDLSSTSGGGNIFGLGSQGSQQMDDLSVLGDLLFGPDEAAAAAAAAASGGGGTRAAQSLLAAHLNPSVFSYSAGAQFGAQGPCVPLCPQGVFSQESSMLSPSPFSSYDQGFSAGVTSAASWSGAIAAGDTNSWNSVGPLAL